MKPITARTEHQKEYLKALYTEEFVICEGNSGSGKDFVAIGVYLDMILGVRHKQERLIITRPLISCGPHDIGSLPGNVDEKTAPYAIPMLAIMNEMIGAKETRSLVEKRQVEFIPLELMRGHTFTNCCVLLSEMQNSTPQQTIMAITRMGIDTHFCFNGDIGQKDINTVSGLEIIVDSVAKTNLCRFIKMTAEDNQRNPKINKILKAIDWKGYS